MSKKSDEKQKLANYEAMERMFKQGEEDRKQLLAKMRDLAARCHAQNIIELQNLEYRILGEVRCLCDELVDITPEPNAHMMKLLNLEAQRRGLQQGMEQLSAFISEALGYDTVVAGAELAKKAPDSLTGKWRVKKSVISDTAMVEKKADD